MKKAKGTRSEKIKGQAKGTTSYLFGCQTQTDKIQSCHSLYTQMYEYQNYILLELFFVPLKQ